MSIEYDFDNEVWIVKTKSNEPMRPYMTFPVDTLTELLWFVRQCSERNLMFIAFRADIGYKITFEHRENDKPFWEERP